MLQFWTAWLSDAMVPPVTESMPESFLTAAIARCSILPPVMVRLAANGSVPSASSLMMSDDLFELLVTTPPAMVMVPLFQDGVVAKRPVVAAHDGAAFDGAGAVVHKQTSCVPLPSATRRESHP